MYPVMRGSCEDIFNRSGQFLDVLCMDPELIQHFNLVTNKKHDGIKTQCSHGQKEKYLELLNPTQPETNSEIILLWWVVRDMCGPPKSLLVGDAMSPIACKVNANQTQNSGPPCGGNRYWCHIIISKPDQIKSEYLCDGRTDDISNTNQSGSQQVLAVKGLPFSVKLNPISFFCL